MPNRKSLLHQFRTKMKQKDAYVSDELSSASDIVESHKKNMNEPQFKYSDHSDHTAHKDFNETWNGTPDDDKLDAKPFEKRILIKTL